MGTNHHLRITKKRLRYANGYYKSTLAYVALESDPARVPEKHSWTGGGGRLFCWGSDGRVLLTIPLNPFFLPQGLPQQIIRPAV